MKQLNLYLLLSLIPLFSFAQINISGKVTDENGSPLRGASVSIKYKTGGTTSDENGRFSIIAPSAKTTLIFSFVGYGGQI